MEDGLAAIAVEAKRVRDFGFSASELDRAKKWLIASYERAYAERDKSESGSFAQELVSYFLSHEPAPGIAYEYELVKSVLPGITVSETTEMAKRLLSGDNTTVLAISPQKPDIRVPTEAGLRAAISDAEKTTLTAWSDTATTGVWMADKPAAGDRRIAARAARDRRHRSFASRTASRPG